MLRSTSLIAFLTSTTFASANVFGGGNVNWGIASSTIKLKAPVQVKNQCSGDGSFLTEFNGGAICCSSATRTSPANGITCPISWSMHKTAQCCIPATEISKCDCGEGHSFDPTSKKCVPNQPNKCSSSQWWHDRSASCCDDTWSWNPAVGSYPPGKTCPSDWFWHKGEKCCKPHGKRSPAPDCPDWNNNDQCCGTGTGPVPSPKHGTSGGGGGWSKRSRAFVDRQQVVAFPQSDLDRMHCPGRLFACSVNIAGDGEWAYECIDPATELESCGGCASKGEGADCTTIKNAVSVGCESGLCAVYSCMTGFAINGTTCVSA